MEKILIETRLSSDIAWYATKDNIFTMNREYGISPDGTQLSGEWVLRKEGEWVDFHTYRTSLAEKHGFKIGWQPFH